MAQSEHLEAEVVDRVREAGLDPVKVGGLVERAGRDITEGAVGSCQLAIARHGDVVFDVTLGSAQPEDRFVIFSCTKALVDAAVWLAMSDGLLSADTKACEVIDGFGSNGKDVVTVQMLLTHTAGFPTAPMGPADWHDRESRRHRMSRWRLNWEPGTRFEYHPTAAHWVLAELVESVFGADYRAVVHDRVLEPLGLEQLQLGSPHGSPMIGVRPVLITGAYPTPDELEAAIGIRLDITELLGEVTDEAKVLLSEPENLAVGISGGGAVSTASNLAMFYQGLLSDPAGLWDPDVLTMATSTVLCDLPDPMLGFPANRSLGLVVAGDDGNAPFRGFGHTVSPRTFGHNGAGGQIAYADPDTGLSFVYLTDSHDRNLVREWKRSASLASRAASCIRADPSQ